jgi:transposase
MTICRTAVSEDILRLLGEVTATGADRTSISDDLRMRIVAAHERGEGRPGDGVVMDNFGLHKVEKVRQAIKKTGAEPLDLPPDSPDLNLIEKAWAKLKQLLRATKARFKGELNQAIINALKLISPDDVKAWFRLPLKQVQLQR